MELSPKFCLCHESPNKAIGNCQNLLYDNEISTKRQKLQIRKNKVSSKNWKKACSAPLAKIAIFIRILGAFNQIIKQLAKFLMFFSIHL